MYPYTISMKLTYSKPINPRVGNNRVNNRVFKGDVLGRSIQMYRMWFLNVGNIMEIHYNVQQQQA